MIHHRLKGLLWDAGQGGGGGNAQAGFSRECQENVMVTSGATPRPARTFFFWLVAQMNITHVLPQKKSKCMG